LSELNIYCQQPATLRHGKRATALFERLLKNPGIQRVAGHQSGEMISTLVELYAHLGTAAFAAYFPKLFNYYTHTLRGVFEKIPGLRRICPSSVFPAATFNCGPATYTRRHRDNNNLAHGLCTIFSGGNFDSKKGGHIIIFDLKLVIEFPPGSIVIIPSGSLDHGNVPIQPGETRVSFTQYCAGAIMRWTEYGFQTWRQLEKLGTPEAQNAMCGILESNKRRWSWAMALFSTVDTLRDDREALSHA
jgi:hypothetical protein